MNDQEFGRQLEEQRHYLCEYFRRKGLSPADAEDQAAQVIYHAFRARAQFDQSRSLKAWLRGIAKNALIDFMTGKRNFRDLDDYSEVIAGPSNPAQELSDERLNAALRSILESLPEPLRVVAVMRFVEFKTLPEIAEALGLSQMGVRHRLERIIIIGHSALREKGYTDAKRTLIVPLIWGTMKGVENPPSPGAQATNRAISQSAMGQARRFVSHALAAGIGGAIVWLLMQSTPAVLPSSSKAYSSVAAQARGAMSPATSPAMGGGGVDAPCDCIGEVATSPAKIEARAPARPLAPKEPNRISAMLDGAPPRPIVPRDPLPITVVANP